MSDMRLMDCRGRVGGRGNREGRRADDWTKGGGDADGGVEVERGTEQPGWSTMDIRNPIRISQDLITNVMIC